MALSLRQQWQCLEWVRRLRRDYQQVADRLDEGRELFEQYGPEVAAFLADVISVPEWQSETGHMTTVLALLDQRINAVEGDELAPVEDGD